MPSGKKGHPFSGWLSLKGTLPPQKGKKGAGQLGYTPNPVQTQVINQLLGTRKDENPNRQLRFAVREVGNEALNPRLPLKETKMVYRGPSLIPCSARKVRFRAIRFKPRFTFRDLEGTWTDGSAHVDFLSDK